MQNAWNNSLVYLQFKRSICMLKCIYCVFDLNPYLIENVVSIHCVELVIYTHFGGIWISFVMQIQLRIDRLLESKTEERAKHLSLLAELAEKKIDRNNMTSG